MDYEYHSGSAQRQLDDRLSASAKDERVMCAKGVFEECDISVSAKGTFEDAKSRRAAKACPNGSLGQRARTLNRKDQEGLKARSLGGRPSALRIFWCVFPGPLAQAGDGAGLWPFDITPGLRPRNESFAARRRFPNRPNRTALDETYQTRRLSTD